jgi:MOSC domain-containing protein YiiM
VSELTPRAETADEAQTVRMPRVEPPLPGSLDPTELVGRRLDIGTTTCEVISRTRRCGMTTAEQPGLRKDVGVLRSLARDRDLCLGVYARVVRPGEVAVGDGITMR